MELLEIAKNLTNTITHDRKNDPKKKTGKRLTTAVVSVMFLL